MFIVEFDVRLSIQNSNGFLSSLRDHTEGFPHANTLIILRYMPLPDIHTDNDAPFLRVGFHSNATLLEHIELSINERQVKVASRKG